MRRPSRNLPALLIYGLALGGMLAAVEPRATLAAWTDFLPRTFDNGAYLEVHGLFEEEENHYADRTFQWSDTFFKEKLTLFSNGYVYHPRFLLYGRR